MGTGVFGPHFGGRAAAGGETGYTAENKGGAAASPGMLVTAHSSGTGFILANATPGFTKRCWGFAKDSIAPTFSGTILTEGLLTLSDWTAATGGVTLAPAAIYFLDTVDGKMTTTPPGAAGRIVQKVGRSVKPDTLEIEIDQIAILKT